MIRRLKECRYKGGICYVLKDLPDGRIRILTTDPSLRPDAPNSGWQQTDKFEWQKTVSPSEVVFESDGFQK